MKLIKRLAALAFLVFVITLFMQNKDVRIPVDYFGLIAPIETPFWSLVTICFCVGFVLAAVSDFIAYVRWQREKRQLKKKETALSDELEKLKSAVRSLEDLNKRLKADSEEKTLEINRLKEQIVASECIQQQVRQNETLGAAL